MGSETPLTDAHLEHLNTFDGRKIGIPDSTLYLCRILERELAGCRAELAERERDFHQNVRREIEASPPFPLREDMMLNRKDIERWRQDLLDGNEDPSDSYIAEANALCDLALQALDRPAERGFDGPSFFEHLQQQGLAMPPGILSRLISYGNCNRCELTPQDSRFLAGVIDELTRTTESTAIAAALRPPERTADARWIPVSERLPRPGSFVLMFAGEVYCACYGSNALTAPHHFSFCGATYYPTHWMPIPPAPLKEPGK